MLLPQYLVVRIKQQYFALKDSNVVDIVRAFKTISYSSFSGKDNASFLYGNSEVVMLNVNKIGVDGDITTSILSGIVIVSVNVKNKELIIGIPVDEVIEISTFTGFINAKSIQLPQFKYCKSTIQRNGRTIHILNLEELIPEITQTREEFVK